MKPAHPKAIALMSHIDSIDERILGELQADGRLTMKALAERVGLSSPAMIERVRRLETRGVITGYRAIVAPETLGRPVAVAILVRLDAVDDQAFCQLIQSEPAITEALRLAGEWTHLVRAHLAGMPELEALLDALRKTGAICVPSVVTSTPLTWREITPPVSDADRALPARRGRPAADATEASGTPAAPAPRRGPGRPRGRRPAA